jgi:hypothetical protein
MIRRVENSREVYGRGEGSEDRIGMQEDDKEGIIGKGRKKEDSRDYKKDRRREQWN